MEILVQDSILRKTEKNKRFRIGLSLGYRWLTSADRSEYTRASISPLDSTLRISALPPTSYLFSTSLVFHLTNGRSNAPDHRPQKKPTSWAGRILRATAGSWCLVSNLNLMDFSGGQSQLAFNKSIEGGLGVGYQLNDYIFLGVNWEHIRSLQLHEDLKSSEGKQLFLQGLPVISSQQLDENNEDLFYTKSLSGWSIKMIVCL